MLWTSQGSVTRPDAGTQKRKSKSNSKRSRNRNCGRYFLERLSPFASCSADRELSAQARFFMFATGLVFVDALGECKHVGRASRSNTTRVRLLPGLVLANVRGKKIYGPSARPKRV